MNPKSGLLHYVVEFLLFLILAAVLVFAIQMIPKGNLIGSDNSAPLAAYPPPATNTPGPTVTSPPYPPPGGAAILPTATEAPIKPPLCQFSSGATPETGGPTLNGYLFSEPRVVITSTTALGIAGWLPNSERLLITRQAMNGHQTIETLDYRTGETITYAERDGEGGKPVWLNDLNAVAYATFVQDHEELWINYGDLQKNTIITSDVSGWSLATDGKRLVYFSPVIGDIPQIWDSSTTLVQGTGIDLAKWEYPKFSDGIHPPVKGRAFATALQPKGTKIAFYGHGWFFLLDEATEQICDVDLGPYGAVSALNIAWSPDGRYIAMVVTPNYPGEVVSSSSILVLDLLSGKAYSPVLESPVVRDIAWSDNSQYLIVLGADPGEFRQGSPRSKIYVINIVGEGLAQEISTQLFGGGATNGWQLAWSPDGKRIAVKCPTWLQTGPTIAQDHICIIEVSQKP